MQAIFQHKFNFNGENEITHAGAAYIFENTNGTWSQVQKIVASDRAYDDRFGVAVNIRGNYAIVGAHWNSGGSAYIFEG